MAVSFREGIHGGYIGNEFDSSDPLPKRYQELNALYIAIAFMVEGDWSVNAIAAILGNMQAESTINPGRWQSDRVGGDATGHGYSLVQWTPYTKYTNWCANNGYDDPSEMDAALARIQYEVRNNIQWIGVGKWYGMTFKEFTQSTNSVEDLAAAFLLCYERPADQSESVQQYRGTLARNWYNYIMGINPDPTPTSKKKKGYNFVLFRRRIHNG